MINKLKYATISDIGVSTLFFYDSNKEEECYEFCRNNLISFLPSKDRKSIYKSTESGFEMFKLTPDLTLNPYDRIFHNSTLKKFEKVNHNEIRFITEKAKIKGVVHIVDYNNENLQVEFYRAFYRFENNVRRLLINAKYKNEDFINWVKEQSETNNSEENIKFWQNRYRALMPENPIELKKQEDKRLSSNPFQTFYLKELLLFSANKNILEESLIKLDSITSLRNDIAHNKDVTSISEDEDVGLVYNFKKLKAFVNKANEFFEAYDYLEEMVKIE